MTTVHKLHSFPRIFFSALYHSTTPFFSSKVIFWTCQVCNNISFNLSISTHHQLSVSSVTSIAAPWAPSGLPLLGGCGKFYTIKSGDTATSIVALEGVSSIAQLVYINMGALDDYNNLVVGQVICVSNGSIGLWFLLLFLRLNFDNDLKDLHHLIFLIKWRKIENQNLQSLKDRYGVELHSGNGL